MNFERNIKIYHAYSTFAELLILGPILTLFLVAKGLSFTEIMILQSISAVGVVAFEVPTGVVADKAGRKLSLMLGSLLWGLGLSFYIFGTTFILFAIAELIFSLGSAFKSGADSALIYDSLKAIGREKEYQKIEGKARAWALYAQAIGSVIAGFVYEINIYLPMIISIFFMGITMLIALNFKEPPIEEQEQKQRFSDSIKQFADSGKFILQNEKLKAIVLFTMVFMIFFRGSFWYYQPYMEAIHIPIRYFGIIFFLFNIVAAISSKQCYIIMEKTKPKTLTFMAMLLIVSFGLMSFIKIWPGFIAILLQQVARGIYRPVTTKYMNKHIPSDKRATILSFQSLATNIAVAIGLPLLGILKDHVNIFTTHLILTITMSLLFASIIRYMNNRLGVQHMLSKAEEA